MLKGSIVALITPFLNGKIDETNLVRLLKKHLSARTQGLVLCGSTGEGNLLSKAERYQIFEMATKVVAHQITLIMACNHFEYNSLLELIDPAYKTILVTPPPYIKPTQEGIFEFYSRLHQDTQADIIIYNNPGRVCVDIDVATVKALFTLPRIIGIKDSNTNLERITELASFKQTKSLLCGEDSMFMDYMARGGNGSISVTGNIIPELMYEFFNAHSVKIMEDYYHEIHPYIQLLEFGGNPSMIKGLMSALDLCHNELRFPLLPIKEDVLIKVKGMLHDIQDHSGQQACHI